MGKRPGKRTKNSYIVLKGRVLPLPSLLGETFKGPVLSQPLLLLPDQSFIFSFNSESIGHLFLLIIDD